MFVSKLTEYGEVVSAAPMFVQLLWPAGERWNWTLATAESVSLTDDAVRLTVPVRGLPGLSIVPAGTMLSTLKAAWWPSVRPKIDAVDVTAPVAPALVKILSSTAALAASPAVSPRSAQPAGWV